MNDINPLFEALGNVDDRHIPVETKKRHHTKLKIALIAAAVAALAVFVGFTTAANVNHKFGFYRENSAERSFELKLTPHEITVPEEFTPQQTFRQTFDNIDIPPRELFEKFGLTYPIGDSFTVVENGQYSVDVDILDEVVYVGFNLPMYSKAISSNIYIVAEYFSKTDDLTYSGHLGLLPNEPAEVITLKDGSLCMVSASIAVFSLDGAKYSLTLPYDYDVPANIGDMPEEEQYKIATEMVAAMPGIDTVKLVLSDLGVYDFTD